MGTMARICGVILAAGESSRMGQDKALLPWPSQGGSGTAGTFLSSAIGMFFPYVDIVLVVAGKNAENVAPVVYANGASLVVNPTAELGQFSSLQTGLHDVLNRGRDTAIITLVDRPPVKPGTLELLLAKYEQAREEWKWAVVPEYSAKHGHPIIVGREMIEAFLKAPATSNAREVEHAHAEKIVYQPVDDPLIVTNVDTPDQYAALTPPMLHSD